MKDRTLLKIVKQKDMGLLFLSLEGGHYGWTLSDGMQKTILDGLENHLRRFESEGHKESGQLIRKLIDDLVFNGVLFV